VGIYDNNNNNVIINYIQNKTNNQTHTPVIKCQVTEVFKEMRDL